MPRFEYKSVPAPKKGEKAKGVKGSDGRMAQAMTSLLNEMGADGWEYLRADTLPLEERSGLTSKAVHYYTVLVFRRTLEHEATGRADFGAMPAIEETPQEVEVEPTPEPVTSDVPEVEATVEDTSASSERPPLTAFRNENA